jgi:hypothetical protein
MSYIKSLTTKTILSRTIEGVMARDILPGDSATYFIVGSVTSYTLEDSAVCAVEFLN